MNNFSNQPMLNQQMMQPERPVFYPNNWQQPPMIPQTNAPAAPVPNWNRPSFSQIPSGIPGRQVNSPQEIRPNEVPMDGTAAFFPMNDYSAIYIKAWGADGNIQTVRFVPESVETTQQGPSEFEQVMARLDSIEQSLNSRYNNKRNNNQKKEVQVNEQ